jgi:hypothetical protein
MLLRTPSQKPQFIEPCRPSKAIKPPSGRLWVHEIKHDGYSDVCLFPKVPPLLVRWLRNTFDGVAALQPASAITAAPA